MAASKQKIDRRRIERLKAPVVDTRPPKQKETAYTQSEIPIRSIMDGIIERVDGALLKVIEIEPINFTMIAASEKNSIVHTFVHMLRHPDLVRIQIKTLAKKVDTSRYVSIIKERVKREKNDRAKHLAGAYAELVESLGHTEARTRRYFVIIQYVRQNRYAGATTRQEIIETLESVAEQVSRYFDTCGNAIVDYRDRGFSSIDDYLTEIIYHFFNRRSAESESFEARLDRVRRDVPDGDKPTIKNIVAPRGILYRPDSIVMDGHYYTFLYIDKGGYPLTVSPGWAAMLVGLGDGVDVDIHIRKEPTERVISDLSRHILIKQTMYKDRTANYTDFEDVRDAIQSGYYIKEALQNGEELFIVTVQLTLRARTYREVNQMRHKVINHLNTQGITAKQPIFEMKEALQTAMPLCFGHRAIASKAGRNMTTTTVGGAMYLFTAYEISDPDGVLLGLNSMNKSLCVLDPFNTKQYKNANTVIVGTSGAGKTFTLQLMALRMRAIGLQCFIIAPEKGHEFKRACLAVGGEYIKIAKGSPNCINIMEIRKTEATSVDLLDAGGFDDEKTSILTAKAEQLRTFFSLLLPDMDHHEAALLDDAVQETYQEFGITENNQSLLAVDGINYKEMPVLGDLYEALNKRKNDGAIRLVDVLRTFVSGTAKALNGPTNVNLDNAYVVLDVSSESAEFLPVSMFLALDFAWDKVREDRTVNKAMFVDEAWALMVNKRAGDTYSRMVRTIRAYGGAVISATQNLSDFYKLDNGAYGKAVINNSQMKIILNLESDELKTAKAEFNLSPLEVEAVRAFSRGQALLHANNSKVPIEIIASEVESRLITTDAAELAVIAEAERRMREASQNEADGEEITGIL